MMVPDWNSSETSVLLNPRMPELQRAALLDAMDLMPKLTGHVWLTTSGSSGIKWVALSKSAILASAQAVNEHLSSTADDVWTLALPTFHVGGLGVLARGFLSGASVHRYSNSVHRYSNPDGEPRWNAASFHAFLLETKTTLTTLVPTQLHDLLQAGLMSPPALRAVVIGGGALDSSLYRAARSAGWPVLPSYGLSECCSQVATAALDSLERKTDDPALQLLSHVTARISEEGRIMVQSASLLTGYGLLESSRFVDPKVDDWFLTEDRGTLSDGALTIQGRIGDFVKIGGESVDVGRLVSLWTQMQSSEAGLPESVPIAVPDARLGSAIHLAATGAGEANEHVARVVQAFNGQVLPFERIQTIHWIKEIPRSPLGKLLRKDLLALLPLQTG